MYPTAVIFDLDDTLIDRTSSMVRYARLFADDFRGALLTCPVETIHSALVLYDDFGSLRQAENICAALPWRSTERPETLFAHWAQRFGEASALFDDVLTVLDEIRRRGIPMGLITNGGAAMQRSKIKTVGLESYFSSIVISTEAGCRKPDASIFQLALAELGCEAAQAWFIGDHPDLDVRGAHEAGLRPFWVLTGQIGIELEPSATRLERLRDLLPHLQEPMLNPGGLTE
jgi:putative hydrolase of the HAD superfamily